MKMCNLIIIIKKFYIEFYNLIYICLYFIIKEYVEKKIAAAIFT